MLKQITIDSPTAPNLFAPDDALITTSTTAIDFVSDDLEKLAVELISNNELRVKSGVFCIGGHYGCIQNGTFETCFISPGNMGFKRKDLIVARYTRVGNLDYIGVQIYTGVPTKGVPVVPSLTVSDLNTNGKIREIALHVVELVDMDIVNVESVFPVRTKKEDINVLLKTRSYTTRSYATGDTQYHSKLDACGIVTDVVKQSQSVSYLNNVQNPGVWTGNFFLGFSIPIDSGYTATDIVAIPSVVGTSIVKYHIGNIQIVDSDGVKKISISGTPYAFAQITTAITSDFSVLVRYKKVKL